MPQKDIINHLNRLKPGYQDFELFLELARLTVLPILEIVPFRISNTNDIEVLLLKRSDNDVFWPGQLHSPGTVYRATDYGAKNMPINRIVKEMNDTKISIPHFVEVVLNKSSRGVELAHVHWAEVLGAPKAGRFFSINNLPKNLIESQQKFILSASKSFTLFKSSGAK